MLHIVNKSHTDRTALASCLRLARDGQALLLTEDGVLAASAATAEASGIAAAAKRLKVYVLAPDAQARGVAERLAAGVTTVDYAGFVDLVAEHSTNQSWL
ncbi:MAG: sulfurtransferase complex subunit TusB [Betaproteobacteria bacterium]|nr:sulfurtransferase complex subunit TusB [Betaproteobacteria bacterium]MCC6247615.1 sulfurtransferase complex subunit TusB [Rubrivivax sp.]